MTFVWVLESFLCSVLKKCIYFIPFLFTVDRYLFIIFLFCFFDALKLKIRYKHFPVSSEKKNIFCQKQFFQRNI